MAAEKDIDQDFMKELREVSPVLARLPKTTPYTVPPAYFDLLPSAMIGEVKQARLVNMAPVQSRWRFAAAAAITGTILLGGWLFMEKRSSGNGLAQANEASVRKNMQQMSEKEMAAYVDKNEIVPAVDTFSYPLIKEEDVNLVLADVSDQELQQFLDQENSSAKLN